MLCATLSRRFYAATRAAMPMMLATLFFDAATLDDAADTRQLLFTR